MVYRSGFNSDRSRKNTSASRAGIAPTHLRSIHPLRVRTGNSGRKETVDAPEVEAITEFSTLETIELPYAIGRYSTARYSLVEARPLTGRYHQIRRHLRDDAHPILGDTKYGDRDHNRFMGKRIGLSRMMLLAREIAFPHPAHEQLIRVQSPIDDEFADCLSKLGFAWTQTNSPTSLR